MKFTDGNWLMREGVRAYYPSEVVDAASDGRSLSLLASTKPIRHRGDTLDGPTLAFQIDSPMPDVVRVRISHFEGGIDRGPRFQLFTENPPVAEARITDVGASLTSGRIEVRIQREGPWSVDFLGDGETLTRSGQKASGYVQVANECPYIHEQLALGVGECVYGLGERFTAFVKNGQVVDLWNKDGGTSSEQAYKNIPFYLTNRGYGVFVNDSGPVSYEVASEKATRVQFSVPGETLEYFVIYGPSPKDVLEKYTALTGRPALPPAWSFGLWLTTSFTTSYDERTVTEFIQGMADRGLPLHVFHFDCFWMKEFQWCDFEWDARTFPDPPAMLARLKERGLRICAWINPYIAQRSALFEEGKRHGYLLKKPNGDVWQTDQWQAGMAIVDFTNPDAKRWYAGHLKRLVEMGVDCFKTDFGERIPTDVVYHDGSDPVRMHNYYTFLYNRTVYKALQESKGASEAVLFARSATAGSQQFPVHWGGDCFSNYESMAESLRGGLSLGVSGFGFWSHDIGGFEGTPPTDVYKRWIAFGLLSSHSRLHGSASYRVPWAFDDEAVDVLRFFTQLKCRLMPYLFGAAREAARHGWPVMRPMLLEFPDDPASDTLDRQYMLGERLLVAPVFAADGRVDYWVPEGRWTKFLGGDVVEGPRWVRENHGFLSVPLLVRPGSIIPVGANDQRPDYAFEQGVQLRVYELGEGQRAVCTVPNVLGEVAATVEAFRSDGRVRIEVSGAAPDWTALLVGTRANAASGCACEHGPEGTLVRPEPGATVVEVDVA